MAKESKQFVQHLNNIVDRHTYNRPDISCGIYLVTFMLQF